MADGHRSEAIDILHKLRGDLSLADPKLVAEVEQLDTVIEASNHRRNDFLNLVLDGRFSGKLHLSRRVAMGLALQQIQRPTGILAIATWAGTLFALAGFNANKSTWLSGLVNTFGVIGMAAVSLVVDCIGRTKSLIISFTAQGIALFLVAVFIKTSQDRQVSDSAQAAQLGTAAAVFVFVFL
jgi:Sugar (and other) transporter